MPEFTYVARTRTGEKKDGFLTASDRRAASLELERLGYFPLSLAERAAAPAKGGAVVTPLKKFRLERRTNKKPRLKLRETLVLSRDLGNLVASGMTLGNALKSLRRRSPGSDEERIVRQLHDDIVQGESLSESLAKHPESFPPFYISMVRAGEASGKLTDALSNLVRYYERMLEAKEKVTMALVYPAIVLGIGVITIIFCMVFVIPKFAEIFEDLEHALPLPTRMLIGMSDFVVTYGWAILAVTVIGFVAFRRAIKTEVGRRNWDRFLLKVPVVNNIILANAFSNFARTLGGLLANGVPVLKALEIVEDTVGNRIIADEVAGARARVTDGTNISTPLQQGDVFPPLLTDMLAVGEDAGDISGSLNHIANRYDEDLTRFIKVFTTVLEPLLMLFMAFAVGFVALSMLLAVFEMTSGMGA